MVRFEQLILDFGVENSPVMCIHLVHQKGEIMRECPFMNIAIDDSYREQVCIMGDHENCPLYEPSLRI